MFNEDLQKNWLDILKFNSKVRIIENPRELDEQVKIPLTPIQVDAFLLYNLFTVLYPRFINEQQNILDIIIHASLIFSALKKIHTKQTKVKTNNCLNIFGTFSL